MKFGQFASTSQFYLCTSLPSHFSHSHFHTRTNTERSCHPTPPLRLAAKPPRCTNTEPSCHPTPPLRLAAKPHRCADGRKYFTKTGYAKARAALLKGGPDFLDSCSASGKACMVTGSNSGVGLEVAQFLAKKGAEVYMVCRSEKRGEEARKAVVAASGNEKVHLLVCDCSLEADVRAMWASFCKQRGGSPEKPPPLDLLVCNAGVLLNELTLTSERVETTFACHLLFGTYLLGELAMPALEASADARVVVVSSGGMYNTKFPSWEVATALTGEYDGNLAYAYAKRGQVLLCERWGDLHPKVKFVSTHPGWTLTPAVDAAYGDAKKYLEPMRSPWEGAEGIAWLCVAEQHLLQSGAFYLDRKVEVKHMAGPFFTQGSFTKNSTEEVDAMVENLHKWSHGQRAAAADEAEALARQKPLREASEPIAVDKFMGKWYVIAQQPTPFDRGAVNSTEEYVWDEAAQRINVTFRMQKDKAAPPKEYLQRATVANPPTNTRWALCPKLLVYVPLNLAYLVADCAADYSTSIIGTPDRAVVYVLARTPTVDAAVLEAQLDKCRRLGYDTAKIELVTQDWPAPTRAGPA